jgi:hypothetical protein
MIGQTGNLDLVDKKYVENSGVETTWNTEKKIRG